MPGQAFGIGSAIRIAFTHRPIAAPADSQQGAIGSPRGVFSSVWSIAAISRHRPQSLHLAVQTDDTVDDSAAAAERPFRRLSPRSCGMNVRSHIAPFGSAATSAGPSPTVSSCERTPATSSSPRPHRRPLTSVGFMASLRIFRPGAERERSRSSASSTGTTIATNAMIENRKTPPTGLITNAASPMFWRSAANSGQSCMTYSRNGRRRLSRPGAWAAWTLDANGEEIEPLDDDAVRAARPPAAGGWSSVRGGSASSIPTGIGATRRRRPRSSGMHARPVRHDLGRDFAAFPGGRPHETATVNAAVVPSSTVTWPGSSDSSQSAASPHRFMSSSRTAV